MVSLAFLIANGFSPNVNIVFWASFVFQFYQKIVFACQIVEYFYLFFLECLADIF